MISYKNRWLAHFTFIAGLVIILLVIVFSLPAGSVNAAGLAQTAPSLGAAGSYSVLAATTVTNTGGTTMPGDLGVSPGSAITGFPPGSVGPPGEIRTLAAAGLAQFDADIARLALEAQGPGTTLDSSELAGRSLIPGVYTVPGVALLSGGTLTLNGDGVYIFLTNGLTSTGIVELIGASACNVFWRDASSVDIDGGAFVGTIIALTSISMGTGATLQGRAIAQTGAVTLDTNTFSGIECLSEAIEPTPTSTTAPNPTTAPNTTPNPASATTEPGLLPDTGGDMTGSQIPGAQVLRIGLGILGLGLLLFGFLLIRNKRTLEK